MAQTNFAKQFINILSQAVDKKIYGSIEVYFEAGRVTQVTQRIINKINHVKKDDVNEKKRENENRTNVNSSGEVNTLLTS